MVHGAAEIVDLRWDQVDLGRNACLHVRRVKHGDAKRAPASGRRNAGAAGVKARVGVRVRVGAGRTVHPRGLRQDGRAAGRRG